MFMSKYIVSVIQTHLYLFDVCVTVHHWYNNINSLWYKAPTMLPAGDQDETEPVPEDGRNYRPKHVELIEIVNKIIIVTSIWLFILLDMYLPLPSNNIRQSLFRSCQLLKQKRIFPSLWMSAVTANKGFPCSTMSHINYNHKFRPNFTKTVISNL